MKHIWGPWRMEYIRAEKPKGCIFCEKPKEDNDTENYILYRGESNFIIMNSYPYNPGHLLVVPYRHLDSPEKLTKEERSEHFDIISHCVEVLRQELGPEGFNLGMNLGKVGGAGIDDHVHSHIVPRWQGDTNFMTIVSDVRVVPEALAATYEKLKEKFQGG
ncbi:HIT domain-containing protein [Chloroflexota bacterium]